MARHWDRKVHGFCLRPTVKGIVRRKTDVQNSGFELFYGIETAGMGLLISLIENGSEKQMRIAEAAGVVVSFDTKPIPGDWNGAGAHLNYMY
ncbi:hypothetical protein CQW23_27910 [Capsicum baccatum]|uniref:Uncharacterized protein n=1 Tax=Capsicum baccatum TaxID=33114 RepID=A0A2G2VF24_CAPBA|nr:hypothetical protein CQW23_27910 [Capsicum baccatum]